MNKTELTQQIENLQSWNSWCVREIDALKAKAAKHQEPTIDWSKMIGRTVETRNYDSQKWKRRVLLGYNPDDVLAFKCDCACKQCRLYEGPTRPNWVEWHGGECPVDDGVFVLVRLRDGEVRLRRAEFLLGWKHENLDDDIVKYTEIQL